MLYGQRSFRVEMQTLCDTCGKPLASDMQFCPSCGQATQIFYTVHDSSRTDDTLAPGSSELEEPTDHRSSLSRLPKAASYDQLDTYKKTPVLPPRGKRARSRFFVSALISAILLALVFVGVAFGEFIYFKGRSPYQTLAPTTSIRPTPHITPTSAPTVAPTATPTATPTSAPTVAPTPTPTPAISMCVGRGCDNKSPLTENGPHGKPCKDDDAYIIGTPLQVTYGMVYLWYSNGCGTKWSETLQTQGTSYIANANIEMGSIRYDTTLYASDVWSPMVYAPNTLAKACGSINNAVGGCTGSY